MSNDLTIIGHVTKGPDMQVPVQKVYPYMSDSYVKQMESHRTKNDLIYKNMSTYFSSLTPLKIILTLISGDNSFLKFLDPNKELGEYIMVTFEILTQGVEEKLLNSNSAEKKRIQTGLKNLGLEHLLDKNFTSKLSEGKDMFKYLYSLY